MARRGPTFVCQNCGAITGRWQGKCESCGEWNTIVEESAAADARLSGPGRPARKGRPFALEPLAGETHDAPRLPSGIAELDRVTGGGFVRGSVLLVGGDPGIGKSTLLIQVAAALARGKHRAVYISGEEAVAQVRLRAERLDLADAPVELAAETAVEDIVATLGEGQTPRLVIIDSIQTMDRRVESAPGTVTQVRGSAQALIRFAALRRRRDPGRPRHQGRPDRRPARGRAHGRRGALFEGEGAHHFRTLRAVKNRFGPTDEIGVFEMTGGGLREVANPFELFLRARLAAPAPRCSPASRARGRCWSRSRRWSPRPRWHAAPRRGRLGPEPVMVLAVLEAHCGVKLSGYVVTQRGGRPASRSRRPISPPPPRWSRRSARAAAARRRVLRRGLAGRGAAGGAERVLASGRRRSSASAARSAGAGARRGRA